MKEKPPLDEFTKSTARRLRRDSTYPERLLWSRLRGGRLGGFKFRRQHPIAGYVADFHCHAAKLVVELDGLSHMGRGGADRERQRALEGEGLRVVRVTNDDVLHDLDAVLELVLATCRGSATS